MSLKSILLASACLCLPAFAAAKAPLVSYDTTKPILFQADRVIYDPDGKTVRISGHVEIAGDGRTLTADDVLYNQVTGRVTAQGHVIIREPNGAALTADEMELTGDLKDGAIKNIVVFLDEYARLAAARATRESGARTTLEAAVFSPCRICTDKGQKEPLWQVKSAKVVWDQTAKRISYEDASFEVFGTPVAGLPFFSHADFSVKNQTGFLAPVLGSSSERGSFVEVPFHWAMDPSYDLTITPMIATEVNPVLKLDWRQQTTSGFYNLSGSYTYDDATDVTGRKTTGQTSYSHIFGRGRFELSETTHWGFDIERASSSAYLRRYQISEADRLTSRLFWEWRAGRSYATVSAFSFQGLRPTDRQSTTPLVLPEIAVHYVFDKPVWGGELAIDGNLLALTRSEGASSQRLSAGLSWMRPEILENGLAVTFFAAARGDIYRISEPGALASPRLKPGDVLVRGSIHAGVDLRWPFVRTTESGYTQIIEPIVQLVVAPHGSNSSDIPNEDSLSLEFDATNLFQPVKFTGLDLIENGPRANIGLRYAEFFPSGGSLEVVAGFQVRADDDPSFTPASGLGETHSDYVSRITFVPWPGLTITNRLRLNKDDFSVRRNEVYVQGTGSWYEVDAAYLKLGGDPAIPGLLPREEASLRTRVHVSDYWSIVGGIRHDLENDHMIEGRFGVAYEDECAYFEMGLRRRYTTAEPSTTVMFTVRLKMLGDGETVKPLFEKDPYLGNESRDTRDSRSF